MVVSQQKKPAPGAAFAPLPTSDNAFSTGMPKPPATPLPWGAVLACGAVLMATYINMMMVFPMLPFMVADFLPELKKEELGYRVGFLGSLYFCGAFLASLIFGRLADVYGRKRTMLLGISGTACSILLFGLSPNYYMALTSRFMCASVGHFSVSLVPRAPCIAIAIRCTAAPLSGL
jgi:MFS family permease